MKTAHELVMAYADAAIRAREPFERCTEADDGLDNTCYREWLYESQHECAGSKADSMVTWCAACQANEDIVKRRYQAAKERGALLRSMQAYARKHKEESCR